MSTGEVSMDDLGYVIEAGRAAPVDLYRLGDDVVVRGPRQRRQMAHAMSGDAPVTLGPVLDFINNHPILALAIATACVGVLLGLYGFAKNAWDEAGLDDDDEGIDEVEDEDEDEAESEEDEASDEE